MSDLFEFLMKELPRLRGVLSRFFYQLGFSVKEANEFVSVMVDALKLKILEKTEENAGN